MLRYTILEASLSFTPARFIAPISAKDYVVVLLMEKAMIFSPLLMAHVISECRYDGMHVCTVLFLEDY